MCREHQPLWPTSYFPLPAKPRALKATIAARFCGVEIEIKGAFGKELRDWLWDYDDRPSNEHEQRLIILRANMTGRMTGARLFKSDAFHETQPLCPGEQIGIFESNSIMRTVARLGDNRCGTGFGRCGLPSLSCYDTCSMKSRTGQYMRIVVRLHFASLNHIKPRQCQLCDGEPRPRLDVSQQG